MLSRQHVKRHFCCKVAHGRYVDVLSVLPKIRLLLIQIDYNMAIQLAIYLQSGRWRRREQPATTWMLMSSGSSRRAAPMTQTALTGRGLPAGSRNSRSVSLHSHCMLVPSDVGDLTLGKHALGKHTYESSVKISVTKVYPVMFLQAKIS